MKKFRMVKEQWQQCLEWMQIKLDDICKITEGEVAVANYNCPGQIVITGETDAVEKASKTLAENGAKRVLPLKVSGPFHSAMLKGAGDKLEKN